jgi:RNA polymerase sigma-70 factor (ECF subfamily)
MQQVFELLEQEIPHLRRYARYLAGDRDQADDLVQDCLVRAVANADRWTPGTNLRAWLFVILKNLFISERRRAARRDPPPGYRGEPPEPAVPAGQESYVALMEVRNAYLQLSGEHQEVLLLVAMEGFSYEEAASTLMVPVGTIRSRLSRARLALRGLLEETPLTDRAEVEVNE